jgi:hypothetical protein
MGVSLMPKRVRGKKLETSMMMDEINSYYGEKGGTGKR